MTPAEQWTKGCNASDANGLTAAVVKRLRENAIFFGDRLLIWTGVRQQTVHGDNVPDKVEGKLSHLV